MANFRAERLFICVSDTLDFDPNEGIDAAALAFIMVCDAGGYDRPSLQDYTFAPFDQPRWFPASEGLSTIRALSTEMQATLSAAEDNRKTYIEKQLEVLGRVEETLDSIDSKDLRFHFQARDLE